MVDDIDACDLKRDAVSVDSQSEARDLPANGRPFCLFLCCIAPVCLPCVLVRPGFSGFLGRFGQTALYHCRRWGDFIDVAAGNHINFEDATPAWAALEDAPSSDLPSKFFDNNSLFLANT